MARYLFLILCLLVASTLTGCVKHIPPSIPSLPKPNPPPPEPQSIISANLRVSLAGAGPALDNVIPETYDTGSFCTALGLACVRGFIMREPMRLVVLGPQVRVRTGLNYEMDGNFIFIEGSCGKPDNTKRRANVALDGKVVWDPSWTFRLQDGTGSVTAVDSCKVTVANVDVTDKAIGVMNRLAEGLPGKADEYLRSNTKLKEAATRAWASLQNPIVAGKFWMDLHPEGVVVTPLDGLSESVGSTLGLYAHPRVFLGTPTPGSPTPLPPLRIGALVPEFYIAPRVILPFKELNAELSARLVGQVFRYPIPLLPDLKVKITDTHVVGSNDVVAIGVDLTGSVKGTAWVIGQITYDSTTRVALIKYLAYDIETRNVLVKIARWLAPKLLDDAVRRVAQDYKYDVGTPADNIKGQLLTALNQPLSADATIETSIDKVTIGAPFTEDANFAFTVEMRGQSKVKLKAFGEPIPTGREIRYVSVFFETSEDDKDAEEPVDLWIYQDGNGTPIAHREVGRLERWGDDPPETQGPYFLRIPNDLSITDCKTLTLRIRKQPEGSATGKGWFNRMTARVYLSDGSELRAAFSGLDQWGDGEDHPFDRSFRLNDVCR